MRRFPVVTAGLRLRPQGKLIFGMKVAALCVCGYGTLLLIYLLRNAYLACTADLRTARGV